MNTHDYAMTAFTLYFALCTLAVLVHHQQGAAEDAADYEPAGSADRDHPLQEPWPWPEGTCF